EVQTGAIVSCFFCGRTGTLSRRSPFHRKNDIQSQAHNRCDCIEIARRTRPMRFRMFLAFFFMNSVSVSALAQVTSATPPLDPGLQAGDALERGFQNPPNSAKPRVWWHWMNGNITKEGIKLDLEWMQRVGLGGFQNFDAALLTPQVVEKRLV